MKTLRNLTLGAALAVFGVGAAFAHGQHDQHGCQAGGERHEHQKKDEKHEHQKDEKHEHDRR